MSALSSVLVACTVFFVAAEEKAKDKINAKEQIVGKWEAKGGEIKGAIVEFTKDGAVKVALKINDQEVKLQGTYKFTGDDTIEVEIKVGDQTMKEKNKVEFKDKDTMTLTDEQKKVEEFKRVTK